MIIINFDTDRPISIIVCKNIKHNHSIEMWCKCELGVENRDHAYSLIQASSWVIIVALRETQSENLCINATATV